MTNDDQEQKSIVEQLRVLISDDEITPEDAVEKVLTPYGTRQTDPLCAYVWPALLRLTRNMQARTNNEAVRRNVHRSTPYRSTSQHQEANRRLRTTVFRDRSGNAVRWDDLTVDQLEAKIAWVRAHIGTMTDHLNIMEQARILMMEYKVPRLGDILDWPDLLRERVGQSFDVSNMESMGH